jgi:hypothetical protein
MNAGEIHQRLQEEMAQVPEASRRGMNSQLWQVAEGYEIGSHEMVGPVVQPAGEVHHWYLPMAHPNLPEELAKVGDEKSSLKFARRYGLLGYPANSHLTFQRQGDKLQSCGTPIPGDPVEVVLIHARQVRWVLGLAAALQMDDMEGLIELMGQIMDPKAWASFPHFVSSKSKASEKAWRFFSLKDSGIGFPQSDVPGASSDEQVLKFNALSFIEQVLSSNIQRIHLDVGIRESSQVGEHSYGLENLRREFRWRSLLDVVYYHLHQQVVEANNPLRTCKECGNFFVQTHGKQQFCPPSEEQIRQAKEKDSGRVRAQSLCGLRFRLREYELKTGRRKQTSGIRRGKRYVP